MSSSCDRRESLTAHNLLSANSPSPGVGSDSHSRLVYQRKRKEFRATPLTRRLCLPSAPAAATTSLSLPFHSKHEDNNNKKIICSCCCCRSRNRLCGQANATSISRVSLLRQQVLVSFLSRGSSGSCINFICVFAWSSKTRDAIHDPFLFCFLSFSSPFALLVVD